MRKLFTMEVPEIDSGIVEIKAVAREPGSRSKIAVHSKDDKVDAVGACVGMKGSRVQSVVRELGGERIDVVLWNEDPIVFVTRALSPAKVVHAAMDTKDGKATVVVTDDQLSLAIGKGGQNARLAAKLTNLKIDLINESQYSERVEFQNMAKIDIAELGEISEEMRARLAGAGYHTVHDLSRATVADLTAIEGVGEDEAGALARTALAKINEVREKFKSMKAAAQAAAEAEAKAEAGAGDLERGAEEVEP
jgi:N utilization substance protein A